MTTHNRVEPVETFHRPASVTMRLVNRTTLIKRSVWSSIAEITSTQTYSHTSAIAFNALLSFFPFIILLLVICSKVLRWEEGFEMILTLLKEHYLPVSEEFITKSLRAIANSNKVALFSIGSLIFTSAGLFAPIELALNHAWQVREERPFWKSQLIAFGLVIGCGLLAMGSVFLASIIQSAILQLLGSWASGSVAKIALSIILKLLVLPVSIAIFFFIYYLLPNREVPLKRVLSTSVFTALLWEVVKYIFIWGLPLINFAKVYGPFYISVTLVMWAFISANILLLGARLSAKWPD